MNKAGKVAYFQQVKQKNSKPQIRFLLFVMLIFLCKTLNAIRVTLSATDFQNHPITEVDAGQLFLWNVTVTDIQERAELLRITNTKRFSLDNFDIATMINQQGMSISYRSRASAEAPGDYQNIKALVQYQNEQHSSNAVTLRVKPRSASSTTVVPQEPVAVVLSFDKTQAMVGEKIIATLKMVAKPDIKIDLKSDLFKVPSFKHGKQFKTHTQEQINGTQYIVDEWQWAIYPQKEGHFTLPVVVADLTIPVSATGFRGMLFSNYEQKRIYSNRITVDIDPLPADAQSAQVIGKEVEVTLQINPIVCKEREGVCALIQVKSDGDLENLSVQTIEGLDPSIESFFSQQKSEEQTNSQQKNCKQFEFILQPKQAGNFEIPPQTIVYFDPKLRQKKTAKSESLMLTVMPKAHADDTTHTPASEEPVSDESTTQNADSKEWLTDLHVYHADKTTQLPWWLFFGIIMMTTPGLGTVLIRRRLSAKKRQPKQQALMAIEQANQTNNVYMLYAILVRYIAAKNNMPEGSVSAHYLEQYVETLPIDAKQKNEWAEMIAQLIAITFDDAPIIDRYDKNLFGQVRTWVELLDRY